MKPLLLLLITLFTATAFSQKLNFTEVWVWEYTNRNGQKAEMAIYREPQLNYWLLTSEAFANTDEMTEWFILKPDGEVLQAYQDGEKNSLKKLLKHQLPSKKNRQLPSYWKATSNKQSFGDTRLGFPLFQGTAYKVSYLKTKDQSTFYLAQTKADFTMVSYFNNLNIDAKLPIRFPKDIPGHYITLSEHTVFPGGAVQYTFKYISQTAYHINLADYKLTP